MHFPTAFFMVYLKQIIKKDGKKTPSQVKKKMDAEFSIYIGSQ